MLNGIKGPAQIKKNCNSKLIVIICKQLAFNKAK